MNADRTPARAEVAVVALAVAANVAHRILPFRQRLASNVTTALAAIAIARHAGLPWAELGLDRERLGDGLRWGVGAGALTAVAVVAVGTPKRTRHRFADDRVGGHGPARTAYELGARIPLETAFAEEVLFRSALLGLALRQRSPFAAVVTSSALFGLWHVLPTWQGMDGSAVGSAVGDHHGARLGAIVGVVAGTAVAGAGFAVIRLRSGSIAAPVIAHAVLNTTTFVLARFATR